MHWPCMSKWELHIFSHLFLAKLLIQTKIRNAAESQSHWSKLGSSQCCFTQVCLFQPSITVISPTHTAFTGTQRAGMLHTVKISQAPLLICVTVSNWAPKVSWRIFMRAVCGAEWGRGVIKMTSRGECSCSSAPVRACLGGGDYSGSTVIWVALSSSAYALTLLRLTIFLSNSFQSIGPHLPLQSL